MANRHTIFLTFNNNVEVIQMLKKMRNKIERLDLLFQYYCKKKLGPVEDIQLEVIQSVNGYDIGRFTSKYFFVKYKKNALLRLHGCEEIFEHVMTKPRFDFEGFEGEKPIRACNFIEFYKIYGDICYDLLTKEELKGLNDYGTNAFATR